MFKRRFLIFDSGIGGLSIFQPLEKTVTGSEIFYLADQAYFPYGSKPKELIKQRIITLLKEAIHQLKVNCLIIACNTATSIALPQLREYFELPIIGIEPVVKPLSAFPNSLLLATNNTLNSRRLKDLISRYQPKKLSLYAPSDLAQAIEEGEESKIKTILKNIKAKFPSPTAIGLSCTHYPLITTKIQQLFPNSEIIDPSVAVAKQVMRRCLPQSLSLHSESKTFWFTTGEPQRLEKQILRYLHRKIKAHRFVLSS